MADFGLQNDGDARGAKPLSVMPPYRVVQDLLPEEIVASLIDHALTHQALFAPTRIGANIVDETVRRSIGTRELGPFRQILETEVLKRLPSLIDDLRVSPIDTPKIELQLTAHGDGAFQKRHIDTRLYDLDLDYVRALSAVYYFHRQPKAFTGGAFRLFAIGDPVASPFIDFEPARNSLLVFPSWAPHEVLPVNCPSQRFNDFRFAVNCWISRRKQGAAG